MMDQIVMCRDGMDVLSPSFLIKICLNGISKNNGEYQLGLIENVIKLFIKIGQFKSADRYITMLHDEYPECMDDIYFTYLIKIQKIKIQERNTLVEILQNRKKTENTTTQFSLINDKGLHIDALIENLLFMNEKYMSACKFDKYLNKYNYPNYFDSSASQFMNYINMKLKDDGNND